METIKFINIFLTSFIITFITIPIVIKILKLNKIIVSPESRDKNLSTPAFGGIAIFIGMLFSFIFWINFNDYYQINFFLASLLILFFVGIIDDFVHLKPWKKILGQIFAISIFLYFSDVRISSMYGVFLGDINFQLPFVLSLLITVFTMLVIINAYNLIDGVDGLAGSLGILFSCFFGFLFFITNQFYLFFISCALIGSLMSFLMFNKHPAKIFMGDTGSMIIGFIFAVFAINIVESQIVISKELEVMFLEGFDYNKNILLDFRNKGPLLSISILIIPLFDTLRVFILRLIKKTSPFQGDTNHIHHNLLECGLNPNKVSLILVIINFILTCLFCVFLSNLAINVALFILLLSSFFLSLIPRYYLNKRR